MRRILGVLVLCFGIAAAASADPVNLTSGTIQANDDYIGSFNLLARPSPPRAPALARRSFHSSSSVRSTSPGDLRSIQSTTRTPDGHGWGADVPRLRISLVPGCRRSTRHPRQSPGPAVVHDAVQRAWTGAAVRLVQGQRKSVVQPGCHRQRNALVHRDSLGNGKFFTRSMALTFSPTESPAPTPEPG